jgi:hypothetical protein
LPEPRSTQGYASLGLACRLLRALCRHILLRRHSSTCPSLRTSSRAPPSDQGQLPAPLCRMLAQDRCCLLALPVKLSHPVRAHFLHPWSPSSIAKFHRSIFDALCVRRHSTVRYSTDDPVSATRQLYREAGDSGHSVRRSLEGLRTPRLCKVSLPRASTDSHSNASKPERSHPQDLPKCTEIDVSTSLLPHGLCEIEDQDMRTLPRQGGCGNWIQKIFWPGG